MKNLYLRAGYIFILINCVKKRLIELIVFKKHPRAYKNLLKNGRSITLERELSEYFWERGFEKIIKEFESEFNNLLLNTNWIEGLEDLRLIRDAIAHSNIPCDGDYIIYYPNKRSEIEKLKKFKDRKSLTIYKKRPFNFKFDDKNYKTLIDGIKEFDEVFFPEIFRQLNFPNYKKIF